MLMSAKLSLYNEKKNHQTMGVYIAAPAPSSFLLNTV